MQIQKRTEDVYLLRKISRPWKDGMTNTNDVVCNLVLNYIICVTTSKVFRRPLPDTYVLWKQTWSTLRHSEENKMAVTKISSTGSLCGSK